MAEGQSRVTHVNTLSLYRVDNVFAHWVLWYPTPSILAESV